MGAFPTSMINLNYLKFRGYSPTISAQGEAAIFVYTIGINMQVKRNNRFEMESKNEVVI